MRPVTRETPLMEFIMGERNVSGVRKVKRGGGKHRLIIDFRYTDATGKRARFRRDAAVQMYAAAVAEAKRLMQRAAETGCPEDKTSIKAVEAKVSMTFREFVEGPFENEVLPTLRPATIERYRALFRQRVMKFFGSKSIDAIELADIRAFAGATAKDGVMLKGPVALVCSVLVRAYESGVRGVPPRLPPGFLPTSRKLPKAPSAAELQKMLEDAHGWLGTAIALAGLAGLRMGEVRALEVRDIDFEENSLVVRRALSGEESLTTKSGHDRVVPMIPELKARLEQAVKGKFPKSRVVLNEKGATPSRQYTLTVFQRFLKQAGIKEWSFHALRHFFISELVRRGAGLEAVRLLAGHSKLEMTQRYAHATGDDLRAAISKLGR